MIRGIYLNSRSRRMEKCLITDYKGVQHLIGGHFELFPVSKQFSIYVDEEGFLKNLSYGFTFAGGYAVFGNALVLGPCNARGENTNLTLPMSFFAQMLSFWPEKVTDKEQK